MGMCDDSGIAYVVKELLVSTGLGRWRMKGLDSPFWKDRKHVRADSEG